MTDLSSVPVAVPASLPVVDLAWWLTAVQLPALAGLFWLGWRMFRDMDSAIERVAKTAETGIARLGRELDAYKLEVAKSYASIAHLQDVERRLTGHLIRIEKKLDARSPDGGAP